MSTHDEVEIYYKLSMFGNVRFSLREKEQSLEELKRCAKHAPLINRET